MLETFPFDRLYMPTPGEVDVYQGYVKQMFDGLFPYRDFWFEYPPGILLFGSIPRLISDNPDKYFAIWVAMLLVLVLVSSALVAWSRKKTTKGLSGVAFIGMIMSSGIFFTHRYDTIVACIVLLAIVAFKKNRPALSAALMTVGAFTKLYPAIFIPVIFLHSQPKSWAKIAAAVVATAIPFLYIWWPGIGRFFEFHGEKPVQIESVQGMLHRDESVIYERFSYVYEGTKSDKRIQYIPMIATLALIAGERLLKTKRKMKFEVAGALMLFAFVIGGNIFSPQYMVWFASFVPFLSPGIGISLVGITWLTTFYFRYYDAIVAQLRPEIWLLWLRNTWLVGTALRLLYARHHQ